MSEPRHNRGHSRQDYGTPVPFLNAVRTYLGVNDFDCDLAATASNAVCPVFYTREDDSLVQPWKRGDGWNWLNPEFKTIAPWVDKAGQQKELHQVNTCMLLPAGVGTSWFAEYVHNQAFVMFVRPRLTFLGTPPNPKTGKPDPYPKDLMLLLYSEWIEPGYACWRWDE